MSDLPSTDSLSAARRPLVHTVCFQFLFVFLGLLIASSSSAQPAGRGAPSQSTTTVAPAPAADPCLQDVLCKGHYQRARNFSKAGEFQSALEEYQIAFKQQPVPWLLLNIARTLHKLGRLPEAIDKYQRCLELLPVGDLELRTKASESLEQAKKELAERPSPGLDPEPKEPPPAALLPTPVAAAPLVAASPVKSEKDAAKPVYKKWWFWTIIGGVVAGGVVAGAVAGTRSQAPPDPTGIEIRDQHF